MMARTDQVLARHYGELDPKAEGAFESRVPWISEGHPANKIIGRLAEENKLKGVIDFADFNDEDKLLIFLIQARAGPPGRPVMSHLTATCRSPSFGDIPTSFRKKLKGSAREHGTCLSLSQVQLDIEAP